MKQVVWVASSLIVILTIGVVSVINVSDNREGFADDGDSTAFPIELVYFQVNLNGTNAECTWETASEKNNDYFTIEHSEDSKNFTPLGNISGAGNCTVTRRYNFTDESAPPGLSYYRMKQTDFDGKFTYSKIITLDNTRALNQTLEIDNIYPSPFDNKFTVTFKAARGTVTTFRLFNQAGQIIHMEKREAKEGINVIEYIDEKALVSGVYVVSLMNGNKEITRWVAKNS